MKPRLWHGRMCWPGAALGAALIAVSPLAGLEARGQGTTTISFDELSERPLDGVSVKGVTFSFTGTGPEIPVALFGSSQLSFGDTRLMSAPWAVGPTTGTLRLDFAQPVTQLSFAAGLTTTAPLPSGYTVRLYNRDTLAYALAVPVSPSTPNPLAFSEAPFNYSAPAQPFTSALVTFDSSSGLNFAFDNLGFVQVPEPAVPSLLLAGSAVLRWRKRRSANTI